MMDYSIKINQRKSCGSCLRWFMFIVNLFLLVAGGAMAAVFLYFQLTQVDFVTEVLGSPLVMATDYMLVAAGCLLILTAFIGLVSGCTRSAGCIAANFIFLIPILLALLAGIVCAFVFKTWLTDPVRLEMRDTLRSVYGVNMDNSWNKRITKSWDRCQIAWKCCAVDDQSWYIYQESLWYRDQPGTPGGGANAKPYVPRSCCVLDGDNQISDADLQRCQTTTDGPPARRTGDQYAGDVNAALRYRGCYEAAKDYMINDQFSWFLVVVCVSGAVAFLVLIGIFVSISFYVSRKRDVSRFSASNSTTAETIQLTRKF